MDYKDFTALDTDTLIDVGLVQPEPTPTPDTPSVDTGETTPPVVDANNPAQTQDTPPATPLTEIEIDGLGKVKIEDIKEWQKGNMRQADYTRKTQEVAKQREQMNDALEVYNYLKANPHLVEGLKKLEGQPVNPQIIDKATPQYDMVRDVAMNQNQMMLDQEVARLQNIYGEVDEIDLYTQAREMNLPINRLEVLYKSLAYGKPAPTPAPTPETTSNYNELMERVRADVLKELQTTQRTTNTIASLPTAPIVPTGATTLSEEEKRVAAGMRMTADEYAKWKNR